MSGGEPDVRVLLTTESSLPYLSGVTVSVDAQARALGARGHEVLVLAPRPREGTGPEPVGSPGPAPRYAWLPSYQLPVVVPDGYRMPVPLPWTQAVEDARRFAPEIVHAHSPFVSGLVARRLARAAGAPLVFTHHTRFADYGHYLGPLAGPGSAVTGAYLRAFWAECAAIVAPSTDLAGEIRGHLSGGRRRRVHVIPTGVDVAGIREIEPRKPREAAGWPGDAVVVASLGRLAPEKSPMEVLEAVASVKDPPLHLVVVGGGPAETELRDRAGRADLEGRVAFTGALPRPEALATIAGADLFAFASRTETQGLVLAEALSAGLAAVAIDGPGVRDSIRDGLDGIVVAAEPSADRPARLGAALSALATDAERRESMAARARDDADRFSIECRMDETEALYRSLVA
jgi:glycosyltransferase involved in cell wall biosynthesis